jgi:hypothetical protein
MMRFKDEWWEKLTPQTTALLKQGFIKALESETDYLTRRSVADALACFVIALLEGIILIIYLILRIDTNQINNWLRFFLDDLNLI